MLFLGRIWYLFNTFIGVFDEIYAGMAEQLMGQFAPTEGGRKVGAEPMSVTQVLQELYSGVCVSFIASSLLIIHQTYCRPM